MKVKLGNPLILPTHPTLRHPHTGEPLRAVGARADGRLIWPIMGAAPDDDPPGDGGDGGDEDDTEVTIDGKTYTIKDLQRIMADEKRQGKRSGERSVLEQLGVESVDAAKALIEAAQEAQRKDETEAQRKAREADEARARADREAATAAEERRAAALERALVRRGCADEGDLEDALALLDKAVEKDADADAIAEAADKLKERRAELFGGTEQTPPPGGGAGRMPAGDKGRRQHQPPKVFGAKGLERAKRRGYIKD